MKEPFKTGKMPAIPLPAGTSEPVSKQPSSHPTSSHPTSSHPTSSRNMPPSSDNAWASGDAATERATDPAMSVAADVRIGTKDRATLTVLTGINAGQVHALDGTEHVVGRGTEADVWIEDGGVSRRHARINCRSDGRYFVEDLGSTNGTFVDGQRIQVCELRPGARLQVGSRVTLRFQISDDAEEELQRRLYESATRDALTRVYNRKYFSERLAAEVAYSRRHRVKLAVLMIDLDDFKTTNDTYGHLAGDMVLRLVSAQMQRLIRIEDLLARYGGEEFVILCRTTGKTEATRLAERIRESIAELDIQFAAEGSIRCTVSIGVAALPDVPEGGANEVLALADARLYRAKADGRNRVCTEGEA